jgi:hypothetical protein
MCPTEEPVKRRYLSEEGCGKLGICPLQTNERSLSPSLFFFNACIEGKSPKTSVLYSIGMKIGLRLSRPVGRLEGSTYAATPSGGS